MKAIGKKIREERKKMGLTQQDLANKLDLSRATISGIERGTISEIGFRKVDRILSMLGYQLIAEKKAGIPTLDDLKNNNNFFGND